MLLGGVLISLLVALAISTRSATGESAPVTASTISIVLNGTVAVDGAATGRTPVPYTGRLFADAGGVPLLRGSTAKIQQGRLRVDVFGLVPDSCLTERSITMVGDRGELEVLRRASLRVRDRRHVRITFEVLVRPELLGYGCAEDRRQAPVTVKLAFRGDLGNAGLSSVALVASAPVSLAGGGHGTLKLTATASIKRALTRGG